MVMGKISSLVPGYRDLGCDPDLAAGLRRRYAVITPGFHLGKQHRNTGTASPLRINLLSCSPVTNRTVDLLLTMQADTV